jgi:GNAT superfamily N-acetyltransferase
MEHIRIRPAAWDDLPHILHQRRAMFAEIGWHDDEVLDRMETASTQYLREALPAGTYRAWMAETDNGIVVSGGGIALVPWPGSPDFPASRRGWILGIYTEPAYRRKGIARQIMDAILAWCRAEGFGYVSLHASKEGRLLYETIGFQPTNEMRIYLK